MGYLLARAALVLAGAAVGAGITSGYLWLDDQHVRAISPSATHPLLYAAAQLPPYVVAGFTLAIVVAALFVYGVGAAVGRRRYAKLAPQRQRASTVRRIVTAEARIAVLEREDRRRSDLMLRLRKELMLRRRREAAIEQLLHADLGVDLDPGTELRVVENE